MRVSHNRVVIFVARNLYLILPRSQRLSRKGAGKVDVRLPGKENSNSHGARPVHLIITMIKWIRTSRLSIKNSLRQGTVDAWWPLYRPGGREQARPSTLNPPPSTLNPQPSTLNPQPSTLIPQPSTLNPQPSTPNPHPSSLIPHPSNLNP